jgi:hypothetical protein
MTWQHDPRVKAVFDEIVARTPDIGDTPAEHTTDLTPKRRRRHRAGVAVATVAAAVIGLAGLMTARAGNGDHPNTAVATPPANASDIAAATTSGVDTTEPPAATTAAPTTVTTSTEAAPTTAPNPSPATSSASPAGFEPLRPGHVAATWSPSGYTASDDGPYLRLSAPTQPADDIWVKVERDTTFKPTRADSAVDVPVRGGTAWVDVVSAKDTTMLLFRDADSVWLIIYAPADTPTDTLVRIADGLTN